MNDFKNMSPELKRMYKGYAQHMADVEAQHKEEARDRAKLEENWRRCEAARRAAGISAKYDGEFWQGWLGTDTLGRSTRFIYETDKKELAAWDAGRKAAEATGEK